MTRRCSSSPTCGKPTRPNSSGSWKRRSGLDPEDLYYLGFHFAEQPDTRRREFGGKVLQLVVKRSPKGKTGQAAKSKLKREGLGG